jgi:hypothetical protein
MGVTVVTKKNGDGMTRPVRGDRVEVHYTGARARTRVGARERERRRNDDARCGRLRLRLRCTHACCSPAVQRCWLRAPARAARQRLPWRRLHATRTLTHTRDACVRPRHAS